MSAIPAEVVRSYGALPPGWRLEKLRFSATVKNSNVDKKTEDGEEPVRLCNYTDVYYNDRITPDMDFMEATATASEIERFTLKRGQVIITKDSEGWDDIGIPAYVTEDMPGVLCGYHLSVLEPDGVNLDGSFLSWLCRSDPLNDQFKLGSNGVTRYGLGQYPLKSAYIPLPDLDTQRRIAGYLDDKTGRIDALIEKKRALLDRLAEKRQALITRAVTRGLNPSAPLKDSGIDWLGKVPAHWEVKPVKRVAKLQSGHTPDKQHDEYWNGEIPWVSLNDTVAIRSSDYIDETAFSITPEGIANSSARVLPARAVVFTRDATIGEAAITTRPMAVSQHIIAWLCPEDLLAPEFLLFVIYGMREELMRITNGTTIGTIGMADVKAIRIALPPKDEQAEIVAYITDRKLRIEDAILRVEASIEKLTEYRAALVTAAVTGKIKALLTNPMPASLLEEA